MSAIPPYRKPPPGIEIALNRKIPAALGAQILAAFSGQFEEIFGLSPRVFAVLDDDEIWYLAYVLVMASGEVSARRQEGTLPPSLLLLLESIKKRMRDADDQAFDS